MKSLVLVLANALVALSTMGSSCINSPFLIAINVDPLGGCYGINSSNGTLNIDGLVNLADLIDDSYVNHIEDARLYDIRVHVTGAYPGGSVVGQASINGQVLVDFSGTWEDFRSPQSLLGRSPHITPDGQGITELVRVLKRRPLGQVRVSATAQASPSPYPSGTEICVHVYAQADAKIDSE